MTKTEALEVLPKLKKEINEALGVLGHPAKFEVLVYYDKSDPLNQRVICAMRVDLDLSMMGSFGN